MAAFSDQISKDAAGSEVTQAEGDVLLHVEAPLPHQRIAAGAPITVTGWALTHGGLRQISVSCGAQRKLAKHGIYRSDLARAFPGQSQMFHAGFQCILEADPARAGEDILTVTAQTREGHQYQVEVPVIFDQQMDEAMAPAVPQGAVSDVLEPMRLNIDQINVDKAGLLHVSGWVIALTRIDAVEVFVDGRSVGLADYGRDREDVAGVWPLYPRAATSGFLLVTDAQGFAEEFPVTIKARAVGGVERQVTIPVLQADRAKRRRPAEMHRLECDSANLATDGQLQLSGWALASLPIERINVYFEDRLVGQAAYGHDRPDVGNQFPTLPGAHRAGFSFAGKLDPRQIKDEHVLELETVLNDETTRRFQVGVVAQQVRASEAPPSAADPMFMLDLPLMTDGVVTETVRGSLDIFGWAVSRDGIDKVIIELDGNRVGTAYHGVRREDVAGAFPDYPNSLTSGLTFTLPGRALSLGPHTINLRVVSKSGAERSLSFALEAGAGGEEEPGPWTLRRDLPASERLLAETMVTHLKAPPHFVIWLKCDEAGAESLRETLRSLSSQVFRDFSIILYGGKSRSALNKIIEAEFASIRAQIRWADKTAMKKTNDHGRTWVIRSDAGEVFSADALAELAFALDLNPGCDLVYADERRPNPASGQVDAFFKPDWSPHLLNSTNYIGRPWAVPQASLERAGHPLSDLDATGDYEILLKCSETAQRIIHVPQVLYGRTGDGFNARTDRQALEHMIKRRGLNAVVEPGRAENTYRVRSKTKLDPLVSIIIPTCAAGGLVKTCLDSLRETSTYKNLEIICIDNIKDDKSPWKAWLRENSDVVVEIPEAFNWSRFNNLAALEATGSYLLFLNDDIEVIQQDWLETMLEDASRPEVGIVGPQLLYPDRKVQHGGIFLTGMGHARHAFRFADADDPGYFGLALTRRDMIGVTGACMLMRREVYDAVGGFDEAHAVINNDLDICLKAHALGLWNIFTPFAQLIHHELASRAEMKDDYDETAFHDRWAPVFHAGDPFFHRHLSRMHDFYQYDGEAERTVYSGHPYYLKRDVTRILGIKVDHIGDFLTALPAFRRIKAHFPKAKLSVLAAPAAVHLAALEPSVDEVIPFDFFHVVSGLGQRDVTEEELEELKAKLVPMNFDIAIDLRKHPDTRKLLKYTGAKVIAGFEGGHAFPWLDIARPFEGDERFMAKRVHVADDIVYLVDQVAAAGEVQRIDLGRSDAFNEFKKTVASRFIEEELYSRKVVCIHPASGTEFRQWPPSYFGALIDELVERDDVNIALIGRPDEQEITDKMMSYVARKERVTSMIGRLTLSELPYFIASCDLFIGNNSGPQHIAATVGVPTVGVHSGVVDAMEWGPLGERALAVRRDMTCSPCYLTQLEDCHRALACLTQLSVASVVAACRRMLHFAAA